ncbi:MAG: hypothetical protein L0221_02795 [Chloroflexi bacterium]|nr:hypothetical protein [Chloroflexota bacterium]
MTQPPWEYLFQPFSRTNFQDIYDPIWISSLVLLVVLVILYNVRVRALHRHRLYTEMWEWLLWTGIITFFLLVVGAVFLFDFFIVLLTGVIGVGVMVWVRFRRYPPLFAAYELQLARQSYFQRARASQPEATIRPKIGPRPSKRRRRR